MKEIIFTDEETRLETLRKIFGINKYKIIRDNISTVRSELRGYQRQLLGMVEGIDEKKEEAKPEEAKPAAKPEVKKEAVKPVAKPEVKKETPKPVAKPETKPAAKPEVKSAAPKEVKKETPKSEVKK